MTPKDLRKKIITGEVDPNNMELFFSDAIKASILYLNDRVKLRGKRVPHFIMNTGDEILYRDLMSYEYSKTDVTDENFVYNEIPRCIVEVSDMQIQTDQLTNPYIRGVFELEYEDNLYEYSAEIRRLPVQATITLKYYVDSMIDSLSLTQYIITNLAFINTYKFIYMGNEIMCSLGLPEGTSIEKPSSLQFDSESRYKTISLDLTLQTNIPVFDRRTCVESGAIITKTDNNIGKLTKGIKNEDYKHRIYHDNGVKIERDKKEKDQV